MSVESGTFAVQDADAKRFVFEASRAIVGESADVLIELHHNDEFSTFKVTATPATLSLLIGHKGQMARALRTLLAQVSVRTGRKYALDLQPPVKAP